MRQGSSKEKSGGRGPGPARQRWVSTALVLVAGVALSAVGFHLARAWERDAARSEFERRASNVSSALERGIADHLQVVESMSQFYTAAEELDLSVIKILQTDPTVLLRMRTEIKGKIEVTNVLFREFVKGAQSRHLGIQALGWAPQVEGFQRRAYESIMRAGALPDYQITQRGSEGGVVPAGERERYVPFFGLEPLEENRIAIGFDMLTIPEYREAIRIAIDTKRTQATAPMTVLQDIGKQLGLVVIKPVYRKNSPARGGAEGPPTLGVFAVGVIRATDMIEASLRGLNHEGITFDLSDETLDREKPSSLLHQSGAARRAGGGGLKETAAFDVAGRRWRLACYATGEFLDAYRSRQSWGILIGGLLFTLLLATYLSKAEWRTAQVGRLVAERTRALSAANEQLEAEVAERGRVEGTLRQTEERTRQIIETAFDAVVTMNSAGAVTVWNRQAEAIFGWSREEALGRELSSLIIPARYRQAHLEGLKKFLATGEGPALNRRLEMDALHRDGHEFPAEFAITPVKWGESLAFSAFVRDMSGEMRAREEKEKLEDQLRQSQKMEAIGALAGGIAHDFNNLLGGILGYANMLKLSMAPGEAGYKAADTIEKAAERAAQLTKQLLGFARKGKLQKAPVDLHASIGEVVALLTRTIDKKIDIIQRLHADRPCVLGDPGQLQQVILNLAVNARDAMPDGGELTFGTEIVELKKEDCRAYVESKPGSYVILSVGDTGCGIPKGLRERIFEPFFTTKGDGKGTGMGLAMVYGIIKNHDGFIRLYSEEGVGTSFNVYLPVIENPAGAPSLKVITAEPVAGTGRILVVDDEEIIRELASDMLRRLGYEVSVACDGEQAVEYYQTFGGEIDLAIIDMVMPRMGGRECFRALKEMNPAVRAILSSGYSSEGAVQKILDEGMAGFVQKPYRIVELSEAITAALQR